MRSHPAVGRSPLPSVRGAAAASLAALALLLAGCGDDEPATSSSGGTIYVDGAEPDGPRDDAGTMRGGTFGGQLSVGQLATFERANSKLVNLTNATGSDLGERIFQAKAACDRLDRQVPMLRSFADRCDPTIELGRLTNVLGSRCDGDDGPGPCSRILTRTASALEDMASTGRAYKLQAKALTDDRECLKRLVPSAGAYRALRSAAMLARQAAAALDSADDAGFETAIADFQSTVVKGIDEDGPAPPIMDRLREACGLVRTLSPAGERTD